jgi:hypothetical protein
MVSGKRSWAVNVGGLGAPDASASAVMMRLIDESTFSRTCSSNVRTLSRSTASFGMMFPLLPAWNAPTVTTALSDMPISRDTIVCRRMTHAAPITTGSTVDSGDEPCPPFPNNVTSQVSDMDRRSPGRVATWPAGMGSTC